MSAADMENLGLPPMELAEKSTGGKLQRVSTYKRVNCKLNAIFATWFCKVILFVCLTIIGVAVLLKCLNNKNENVSDVHKTHIIIVSQPSNGTNGSSDMKVFLDVRDKSSNKTVYSTKRRKRSFTRSKPLNPRAVFSKNSIENIDIPKAREVIMNDVDVCDPEDRNAFCKNMLKKLNVSVIDESEGHKEDIRTFRNTGFDVKNNDVISDLQISKFTDSREDLMNHHQPGLIKSVPQPDYKFLPGSQITVHDDITLNDKSEFSLKDRSEISVIPRQFEQKWPFQPELTAIEAHPPHEGDCLLSRLMNQQNLPQSGQRNYYGNNFNNPNQYLYNRFSNPSHSYSTGFASSPYHNGRISYHQDHPTANADSGTAFEQSRHPQDVGLSMQHIGKDPSYRNPSSERSSCLADMRSCTNEDVCIDNNRWCDGAVDCMDASDETSCPCRARVAKNRLCDAYYDCPFGEDEMGCFGCNKDEFSCDDVDLSSKSTCFLKSQRCDGNIDCPNKKDEIECNLLAPSLHEKPIFGISHTEGFLHRNYKGRWYPVCENPYMWAHDACLRETGLLVRPPFIKLRAIDPFYKGHYINNFHGDMFQLSDTCYNNSAIYVVCQDLMCGSRVLSTVQILRENINAENHMYGRLKREVLPQLVSEGLRKYNSSLSKRESGDGVSSSASELHNDGRGKRIKRQYFSYTYPIEDVRDKRAENRVVGGKPSQPGAWPWMVAIFREGSFHCGGVIITNRWIVSAAHCVHSFWEHYYEVQVGMLRRYSFSPQEQSHKVTHIIVNQQYNRAEMSNDLSLLRVAPEIQFSRWVRPICLPSSSSAGPDWMWGPPAGTVCMAVGWGATIEHGPDPDHIREVEVPIWEMCKHRVDIAGNEICAGTAEGGKDACQGDSGGPLLCQNPMNSKQWYMAGIVSHGEGCARKGEPGVYTRVSMFVQWIYFQLASKHLPALKPKQDCPGFRCVSGITKCLPKERKCDKIVDCLDGEDEIDCDFIRSSVDDNTLLATTVMVQNETQMQSSKTGESTQSSTEKELSNLTTIQDFKMSRTEPSNFHSRKESTFFEDTEDLLPKSNANTTNNKSITPVNIIDSTTSASIAEERDSDDEIENVIQKINFKVANAIAEKSDLNRNKIFNTTNHQRYQENKNNSYEEPTNPSITSSSDETNTNYSSLPSSVKTNEIKNDFKNKSIPDDSVIHSSESFYNNKQGTKNEPTGNNKTISPIPVHNDDIDQSKELHMNSTEIAVTNIPENKELPIEISTHPPSTDSTDIIDFTTEFPADGKLLFPNKTNTNIAQIKKKILRPSFFQCMRIPQTIMSNLRCNHKADCEDGTDELECSCVDYITTFNHNLLCDGFMDCYDGSDERDCFTCGPEEFLCKWSRTCISLQFLCDRIAQCPDAEDELDCSALTNGQFINFDVDGRPEVNLEGYLTERHPGGTWHVVCEDDIHSDDQEKAAATICQNLGFSGYHNYKLKHFNINQRKVRNHPTYVQREQIQFIHQSGRDDSPSTEETQKKIIKDPVEVPSSCVPNIRQTCVALLVTCSPTLNSEISSHNIIPAQSRSGPEATKITNEVSEHKAEYSWPWAGKVYVEGEYRCTGVLIHVSWLLISHACLWDALLTKDFVSVVLGSKRSTAPTNGPFEQILEVDAKVDIFESQITLLRLREPAKFSRMVKPMVLPSLSTQRADNEVCVTVGQGVNNRTETVVLEEVHSDCGRKNKCFVRHNPAAACLRDHYSGRSWAGVIVCKAVDSGGWHPVASYVEPQGECGFKGHFIAISLGLTNVDIKDTIASKSFHDPSYVSPECPGVRCARGRCVPLRQTCDHVTDCEDKRDEDEDACQKKQRFCLLDPHDPQCACNSGQLKCRNGVCVAKQLFGDGHDDCGDASDEPPSATCAQYLARVNPHRLCDGSLHCFDRSDEDPDFCKCFSKRNFKCSRSDTCVALDLVCDGVKDCPSGEDESSCIGLGAPIGTPYGTGEVIERRFGVWHTKCYLKPSHTRSELEKICRDLGFISGHARLLRANVTPSMNPNTNVKVDEFTKVILNEKTTIVLRNSDRPMARAVVDETMDRCYPVFIECI